MQRILFHIINKICLEIEYVFKKRNLVVHISLVFLILSILLSSLLFQRSNALDLELPNISKLGSSNSKLSSDLLKNVFKTDENALSNIFPQNEMDNDKLNVDNPVGHDASTSQYIVKLKDDIADSSDMIFDISAKLKDEGIDILYIYQYALKGFLIKVPNNKVLDAVLQNPFVDFIEKDQPVDIFSQTLPTGINRVDADLSSTRSGNGGGTVNVDIAILDTGIDLQHPDLNVYSQKNFVSTSSAVDDNGHGTHVAGIAAAKDNSIGVVGVAPGAKLWAIKVLDSTGSGYISTIIKGIDYVTQYAAQIEVANLSLGCECTSTALDTAIYNSIKAGVTYVVAAGNAGKDASTFSPAKNPNVIAVSAIGDSDGKCGGKGPATGYGSDDTLASFSNYGSVVDMAAPGVKILSTYKGSSYATMSGTSMASPYVAGAAALYKSMHPSASPSEVRNSLISNGSISTTICDLNGHGYFTGDKDTYKEPFLYVKNY